MLRREPIRARGSSGQARRLSRNVRPRAQRPRRRHPAQPPDLRRADRRGRRQSRQGAAVHRRRAPGDDRRGHRRSSEQLPDRRLRRSAHRPGGAGARRLHRARHPSRLRLRVRVPDGAHEPQAVQHGGDGVPDAAREVHVHLVTPDQGSGRLRRVGGQPGARRRREAPHRKVSTQVAGLSRRRSSMPVFADRLKSLAPSSTLAVQARARELRARGVDVISFGAGEPDFDTPARIKDAAVAAMRLGQTKYTEVGGIAELRAAVAAKLKRDNGLHYEPADVVISCGAKHTLFNIMVALLNPGDQVLVPSPYWVSYPEQARLLEADPVAVTTDEATGFDLDPARLRDAVTPRTKIIVVNSPNNPTGAVFSQAALEAVARLAVDRQLWVISDECYEALTFEGRHISIAQLGPDIKARTIVVNTCSKAYAMTGWRIGYAAGPRDLIRAMTDVQSQVTSNPSSVAQWAAVEALSGPQDEVAKMAGEFDRRRRLIIGGLNALPGVSCVMPKGAFYAFANFAGLFGRTWTQGQTRTALAGSLDVTGFLLEAARVAVVPGLDFGSDAHVRLSYATSDELISEGLERMKAAIATLG